MEDYKKKKITFGIFVFSVLVVFALSFIIVTHTRIIGQASQEYGETKDSSTYVLENIQKEIKCEDSDNGINYGIKGTLIYCSATECLKKEDYCSGNKLIERYCEDKLGKSKEYGCEFKCDDGVCLTALTKYRYFGGGGSSGGVSSSGGSSSRGVISAQSPQIYELGQLSTEATLNAGENEGIRLNISSTTYLLTLNDITETQINININGVQNSLSIGEEKRIDLNSDGTNDVYIKLRSINIVSGKAKLTLNTA